MHLMIDTETLDVGSFPVLLSIGAVVFNPYEPNKFIDFERIIDPDSCIKLGATISFSTIRWWFQQNKEARDKIAYAKNTVSIDNVLNDLTKFIKDNKVKKVWSHGANFDAVLIDNYYKALNMETPYIYYNVRDTRTIFDLTQVSKSRTEPKVKHNALEDARAQANDVCRCYIGFQQLMEKNNNNA
ncbi:MAG: 3'-5' exoribonuclease [Proteobacteria bacterium]|nr:3'-5' exoribonuclease [Pseudomonadota bacterium]